MSRAQIKNTPIQWLGKILAGLLLGLTLAVTLSGLYLQATPDTVASARAQLMMWMVIPLWLTVLGFSFAFRSARHAWGILGAINLLLISLYLITV